MSEFDEAIALYSNLPSKSDSQLTALITSLDSALVAYRQNQNATTLASVNNALSPINTYYTQMRAVNKSVRSYLKKGSVKISNSQDTLINEDRYDNRVHPEESTSSREVMYGIFPKFRETSLPYILTAGVFMGLMTIFLVIQSLGFSGQINLPLAITQYFTSPAGGVGIPFYKNPMVLGGLVAILASALVIFIVLYFKAKKANSS
jgi:hypothetical protein